MSDQYRLVFAGEVLEGQHPAVVKKRLAGLLKVNDEQAERLFSGKPVVVKKAADRTLAARYQKAFKEAGARLRVSALAAAEDGSPPDVAAADAAPTTSPDQAPDGLQVLPPGADILTPGERSPEVEADVDTSHLSVQGAVFTVDEPVPETPAPDVSHLSMAAPGERLGPESLDEADVLELDIDFDLAEVGATIGPDSAEQSPALDLESVDFDLAEAGSDLNTKPAPEPPPPPNTDHLQVDKPD